MTTKTLSEIQFDLLKTFIDEPQKFETKIDLVLKYKYDLFEILGSFPLIAVKENFSPYFLKIPGEEFNVDEDVNVLMFFQEGLEEEFQTEYNAQGDLRLKETNLFALNDILSENLTDVPLDLCYYRIKFNLNQSSQDEKVVFASIEELKNYVKIIVSISNVTEVDSNIYHLWQQVPLVELRSKLYLYALQHPEVQKIWVAIISTTLYVFYEVKAKHSAYEHKQALQSIVQPNIPEQLTLSVSDIKEGIDLIGQNNLDDFQRSAILYNNQQWHFWLLRWFRIRKTTLLITINPN